MGDDFQAQVAGIALLNDPVRRSLYQFVVRSSEAVSRDQAAQAAGVQRALAAFHLDRLADEGLLDVEFKRLTGRSGPGAGRPSKLYRRSDREIDVTLPPREYDLAAHLLAAAIDDASGGRSEVRQSLQRIAFQFGRQLGQDARSRAGSRPSLAKRRDAVIEVLREHGFEPRWSGGDIVLGNCPFHSLAQQFTGLICGMNLHLMEGFRSSLGVNKGTIEPRLAPEPGRCCVRFGSAA